MQSLIQSKFYFGLFQMQKYKINMVKIAKKQKILIEDEKIPLLMQECQCSRSSIYYALSFVTNSSLAKKIRDVATTKFEGKQVNVPFVQGK